MEIIYGIAGVLSLTLFAAFMGPDIRTLFGRSAGRSWMEDDPNSTLGVMRDVLSEMGDSGQSKFQAG